ncbi:MAG: helix-turn-helix domain-containing protein [Oscillospiraceae bacterium]
MEKKRILTIKEAAALIDGLTEYRVRQMCITGQLPCFKAGRKYLISEENLMNVVFGDKSPVANGVVKK